MIDFSIINASLSCAQDGNIKVDHLQNLSLDVNIDELIASTKYNPEIQNILKDVLPTREILAAHKKSNEPERVLYFLQVKINPLNFVLLTVPYEYDIDRGALSTNIALNLLLFIWFHVSLPSGCFESTIACTDLFINVMLYSMQLSIFHVDHCLTMELT